MQKVTNCKPVPCGHCVCYNCKEKKLIRFCCIHLCSMKVKSLIPQKDYMELELILTMV